MDANLSAPLSPIFGQVFSLLFSFLDDAILLGLSRLGLHLPWLQWLSPILFSISLLVWTLRLLKFANRWRIARTAYQHILATQTN